MVKIRRMMWLLAFLLVLPGGCSETVSSRPDGESTQRVRVRLLQDIDTVDVSTSQNVKVSSESQPEEKVLAFPSNKAIPITLDHEQWKIGSFVAGRGALTIKPTADGSVFIGNTNYHGFYKFIPVGDGKFDVINDVNIDDYCKGVVAKEMYSNWHIEAYRAQAIVARTYAMFQANTAGLNRYWDLYPDQHDQVYGGIPGETPKAIEAVNSTSMIVLTYGPASGKIFKTYFSSCCGGVTASASDVFPGDINIDIPPLKAQSNGTICNASHLFNWGPITIKKDELTRRIKIWAERKSKMEGRARPELAIAGIWRIDVVNSNFFGRPTRVIVTDTRKIQYSWFSEDLRTAVNTDAPKESTIPSSFCKINGDPNSDAVTFYDGHGFGHGVGMCQWCAQARAEAGESHEQILSEAFPQSKLARAY